MIAWVGVRVRGRGTGTLLTAYAFTHDRFSATVRVRIPADVHLHQTHTPLSNIFFFFSFFFLFSPFLFFLGGGSLLPKKTFHEEPKNDCDEHTWPVPANAQCTGAYLIQYYFYSWKLVAYHIKSYRIELAHYYPSCADVRNSDDPCNYAGVPLCKFTGATDEESCKQGCCDIGPTCKYLLVKLIPSRS